MTTPNTTLGPVSYRVAQEMDKIIAFRLLPRKTIVAYAHVCFVAVLANLRAEGVIPKFTRNTPDLIDPRDHVIRKEDDYYQFSFTWVDQDDCLLSGHYIFKPFWEDIDLYSIQTAYDKEAF